MAAALDYWAFVGRSYAPGRSRAERLVQAARAADPDPWRNVLRDALQSSVPQQRLDALHALARSAKIEELPPVSLDLLGTALSALGDPKMAEGVLRQAQRRYPGDVWLNYNLAWCLIRLARREEAIRYFTAARSIRPETAHALAHVLEAKGESHEAIEILEDLARLRPNDGLHLGCLGRSLKSVGRGREAKTALDAAIAVLRARIRQNPDDFGALGNLGNALCAAGHLDAAIDAYQDAIRLKPDDARSHSNLALSCAMRNVTMMEP